MEKRTLEFSLNNSTVNRVIYQINLHIESYLLQTAVKAQVILI